MIRISLTMTAPTVQAAHKQKAVERPHHYKLNNISGVDSGLSLSFLIYKRGDKYTHPLLSLGVARIK